MTKQKEADTVREEKGTEWLMHPNVEAVATMQDTEGDFFVAVGVTYLVAEPKLPKEIDGVRVTRLRARDVSIANGATDISHALRTLGG